MYVHDMLGVKAALVMCKFDTLTSEADKLDRVKLITWKLAVRTRPAACVNNIGDEMLFVKTANSLQHQSI